MIQKILMALLITSAGATATKAEKPVTVPTKDGLPAYERAFYIGQNSGDGFYAAKLFLAEYFKRSVPQIVVEDKDAARLSVRTCLFYHFLANPDTYRGRLLSLMDISFRGDSCFVKLYDWQVQRSAQKDHWVVAADGRWYPDAIPVWKDQNEKVLLEDAAKGRYVASAELTAVDKVVVKMLEEFQKRVSKQ